MQLTMSSADSIVGGSLNPVSLGIPAGAITDSGINANAGVQAPKVQQQYLKHYSQGAVAVAADRRVIHVVRGTGGEVCSEFLVGVGVAQLTGATFVVDLQANGISLLSGGAQTIGASGAYVLNSAALAAGAASIALGSVIEVVITSPAAGGGTLGQEVFAQAKFRGPAQ